MVEQMLSWHALDLQIESRSMGNTAFRPCPNACPCEQTLAM
ncbi:hypothetical protein [Ruminococcus bicirculans (ex Wegman et al. 2014)]